MIWQDWVLIGLGSVAGLALVVYLLWVAWVVFIIKAIF